MLLGDDALNDVEAETGAFADRLGREERLEDPRLHVGGNADAVVDDAHDRRATVAGGLDPQHAMIRHRVDRVVGQIGPDLIELAGKRAHRRQIGRVVALERDVLAFELVAEHHQRAVDPLAQIGPLAVAGTVHVRVDLHRADQLGDASRGGTNIPREILRADDRREPGDEIGQRLGGDAVGQLGRAGRG